MSIPPEDHYRQRLTEVKCIGLQWAERARKVYKFLILTLSCSLTLSHWLFCFIYRLQLILELSVQIKFLNLSWKVKICLFTWRRKLRYRDKLHPPPTPHIHTQKNYLFLCYLKKEKEKYLPRHFIDQPVFGWCSYYENEVCFIVFVESHMILEK